MDVVQVDRRGQGAEGLEEVEEEPAGGRADREPRQVVGVADHARARRDLAKAVLERRPPQAVDALPRHLASEEVAELAVHDREHVRVIVERVRQPLHLGHGHDGAEEPAHQREELDAPGEQHLERGGVAARDAVVLRADAHLDEPVRLRAHRAPHLAEPSVERARLRLVMELPVDGHVTPGVPRGS